MVNHWVLTSGIFVYVTSWFAIGVAPHCPPLQLPIPSALLPPPSLFLLLPPSPSHGGDSDCGAVGGLGECVCVCVNVASIVASTAGLYCCAH